MESHRALYSAIVLGDNADDTQLFSLCHMSQLKDINVQIACWFLLVRRGHGVLPDTLLWMALPRRPVLLG